MLSNNEIEQMVKSIELKDVVLVKYTQMTKEGAMQVAKVVQRPVIYVRDFDDISSISIEELEKLTEKAKNVQAD